MKSIAILVNRKDGINAATKLNRRLREIGVSSRLDLWDNERWYEGFLGSTSHVPTLLLRWGTTNPHRLDGARTINSINGIRNAYDKPLSMSIFKKNNIPIPRTWYNIRHAKLPFIARPRHHAGGKNFFVVRDMNDLQDLPDDNEGWYYREIYPKTKEFRLHVGCGEILHSV